MPTDEITMSKMAARLGISKARLGQLIEQNRIRPAPRKIEQGRNFMYLFAGHARKVGEDKKAGRPPKSLDKAK